MDQEEKEGSERVFPMANAPPVPILVFLSHSAVRTLFLSHHLGPVDDRRGSCETRRRRGMQVFSPPAQPSNTTTTGTSKKKNKKNNKIK